MSGILPGGFSVRAWNFNTGRPCPPGSPRLAQPLAGVAVPSPGFAATATAAGRGHGGPSAEGPCAHWGQGRDQARFAAWSSCPPTELRIPVPGAPQSSPCREWVPWGQGLPSAAHAQHCTVARFGDSSCTGTHERAGADGEGKWGVSAAVGALTEHLPSATTRHIPPPLGLTVPPADAWGMLAGWRHEAADGGAAPGRPLPAATVTILVLSCCEGTPLARGLPHHGPGYRREGEKGARAFSADCGDPEEPCSHAGTGDSLTFHTQQKLCEN